MWKRMLMCIFLCSLWSGGLGITCLDALGNSVDWYAIYKLPALKSSSNWMIRAGLAPLYLDVRSPKWALLNHAMNESQEAVYQTLSAIYSGKNDDMMYIMYNDEPPPASQTTVQDEGGHTKGVMAFDKNSGFWLIHSAPHFPPGKDHGYTYPTTACHYGQSFLCVTFPYNQLGNVGANEYYQKQYTNGPCEIKPAKEYYQKKTQECEVETAKEYCQKQYMNGPMQHLWYNEPHIYNHTVPASFSQDYPVLNDVIHGKTPPGPPYSSVLQMTSLGGQQFTSFAKSGKFKADLYDALVAPTLQQDLLVETWLNGEGGKLDSNCSAKYKVLKITSISMQAFAVKFNETKDHSKWAISTAAGFRGEKVLRFHELEKWTCIGDINRMCSQFKRGGGMMCLQNSSVWQAYTNTVASYNKC